MIFVIVKPLESEEGERERGRTAEEKKQEKNYWV
jgi:hypothetical protein